VKVIAKQLDTVLLMEMSAFIIAQTLDMNLQMLLLWGYALKV
jgi:hypothetical protein